MSKKLMFAYRVELRDGSVHSGRLAVPGSDPATASSLVVGILRKQYQHDYEECGVTCIGPA